MIMNVYITITGLQHYINYEDINPEQEIILRKEPNNQYDLEAIAVYMNDTMKIGYISNSVHTKGKGTYFAGRLYDKIQDETKAKIVVVMHHHVIGLVQLNDEKAHTEI